MSFKNPDRLKKNKKTVKKVTQPSKITKETTTVKKPKVKS